jgi:hypothetical protein
LVKSEPEFVSLDKLDIPPARSSLGPGVQGANGGANASADLRSLAASRNSANPCARPRADGDIRGGSTFCDAVACKHALRISVVHSVITQRQGLHNQSPTVKKTNPIEH